MSAMAAQAGATAPAIRLSRKGVAALSATVMAVAMLLLTYWNVSALAAENEALRTSIRTLKKKAEAEKTNDPREQKIQELETLIQSYQLQAQHLTEISGEVAQAASEMPEFKSPQYKQPYQALVTQLQRMTAAVQILQTEGEK